ncbi:hypothetical protein [Streptomyces sp. NPDC005989]|uniref:hypothetical protein n=1 Tax=Streptomyces sp. NPDC005989 TaxID=3156727 RepID=UPI0033ED8CBD
MSRNYSMIRAELRNKVLWATIDNPPVNLIDERFVTDLIALLDDTEAHGGVRVVVFRGGYSDFFISHVDGPDDSSLGTLFRRLSEAHPVTIAVLEGRGADPTPCSRQRDRVVRRHIRINKAPGRPGAVLREQQPTRRTVGPPAGPVGWGSTYAAARRSVNRCCS